MSFLKKESKSEPSIIFDIGSASINASIVIFSETHLPHVVYSLRLGLPITEHPDSDRMLTSIVSLIKDALAQLEKEGIPLLHSYHLSGKAIRHIHCVLASPWYVSQTKTLEVERKSPIVISEDFISEITGKEEKAFEDSIAHSAYADTFDKNVVLAEQKVIHIKLNGYETKNPYGKKSSHISFSFFSSLVSKKVTEKITEVISSSFDKDKIKFHSFCLASFGAFTELFSEVKDFLMMDITGEVTDVSLVRGGIILETASFPSGRNFLARRIMKKMNTNAEVALSYLSLYANKTAEPALAVKVEQVIKEVEEEWVIYLNEVAKDLAGQGNVLPRKVFLTVDDDVAPVFLSYLKRSAYPLDTLPLNEKQTSHIVAMEKGMKADPFIALEAVYLNKIFHNKN
ncbi:MAG: hypothetical protein U1D31_00240 [Patescibacteria group bacterium]|nr:hypothetical protein [bacterium]MDZ4240549.1 hypothetical protein [Patescibacteria group bacterium]